MKIEDTEEFKELKSRIPAEKMDDFMAAFKRAKEELTIEELDSVVGGKSFKQWWEAFKKEWWE